MSENDDDGCPFGASPKACGCNSAPYLWHNEMSKELINVSHFMQIYNMESVVIVVFVVAGSNRLSGKLYGESYCDIF